MTSADIPAAPSPRDPGVGYPAAVDRAFVLHDLAALRAEVATHATALGAARGHVECMLIVAIELATNAVRHGGGTGRLQLWRDGRLLFCRVSDRGPGMTDPAAGTSPPAPRAADGRGLWLCRHLTQHLDIRSAPTGTTATAALDLTMEPQG